MKSEIVRLWCCFAAIAAPILVFVGYQFWMMSNQTRFITLGALAVGALIMAILIKYGPDHE